MPDVTFLIKYQLEVQISLPQYSADEVLATQPRPAETPALKDSFWPAVRTGMMP